MQCSWPRVRTTPSVSSGRNFAGRNSRPFSSRRGVNVPKKCADVEAIAYLPALHVVLLGSKSPASPPLHPTVNHNAPPSTHFPSRFGCVVCDEREKAPLFQDQRAG